MRCNSSATILRWPCVFAVSNPPTWRRFRYFADSWARHDLPAPASGPASGPLVFLLYGGGVGCAGSGESLASLDIDVCICNRLLGTVDSRFRSTHRQVDEVFCPTVAAQHGASQGWQLECWDGVVLKASVANTPRNVSMFACQISMFVPKDDVFRQALEQEHEEVSWFRLRSVAHLGSCRRCAGEVSGCCC